MILRKPWLAMVCGLILFSTVLVGLYNYKKTAPMPARDRPPPEDVALTLIDVLGDSDGIRPGSVTAECLSAKVDRITDQYEILLSKIHNNPGTTHYIDGLYVTLMPTGRRPVFQVRYPNRKYCAPFVEKYKECYAKAPEELEHDRRVLPSGRCIKEAAKAIRVTEDWEGLIERYEPQPSSP